jgi:hypothetical protein
MKKILLFTCFFLSVFSLSAATVTWIGPTTGNWADAVNWSGGSLPSAADEVVFNNAASNTITLATTITVVKVKVINNTSVTLKSSITASLNLNISGVGGAGDDLIVEPNCTLNVTSNTSAAGQQIIQIVVSTGATGSISGNMDFSNTSTNNSTSAHRLLGTDINSVTFQTGSVFTANIGLASNPFGATNLNTIIFASGSRYISKGGTNPFGASGTNTVVVFQLGSTYQHDQTSAPALSGRTYPNFEYTKAVGSATGVSTLTITGNLTIKNGGGAILNLTNSNSIVLLGDLKVESGGSLSIGTLTAATVSTSLNFSGNSGSPQTIINNGTLVFDVKSRISVNNGDGVIINSNLDIQDLNFQTGYMILGGKNLKVKGAITGANNSNFVVTNGTGNLT